MFEKLFKKLKRKKDEDIVIHDNKVKKHRPRVKRNEK